MSDLIDRQKAIKAVCESGDAFDMIERLNSLLSAERKTGRWIKRTRIYESGTCTSYEPEWYCSECRTKYDPYFAFNRVNFCYVCGADMRGEKDEHEQSR